MIRFTKISINDIVFDSRRCSEIVAEACARPPRSRPAGLLRKGDNILVCLEACETEGPVAGEWVFDQFHDPSEDGILAEIKARYYAGFSMVGFFDTGHSCWALFERQG